MKRLSVLFILLAMCFLSGCLSTGVSTFPIQIKNNSEILAPVGFTARVVASYVKAKYPAEIQLFMDLSDKVLKAESDKVLEVSAQRFVDELVNTIKDPVAKEAVRAYIDSYEISIDTNQIIFDPGSRQTARDTIKMFREVLGGK